MEKSLFRSLTQALRKRYPHVKVRVRRGVADDGTFATTHVKADGVFVIVIDKDLPELVQCHFLAHEWAHAVSWHIDTEEHGDAFWMAYRQCYDAYLEWCKT